MKQHEKIREIVDSYNLQKKSRVRDLVLKRQYFCFYLRGLGYTYESIADYLGKDHATAIYSVKSAKIAQSIKDVAFSKSTFDLSNDMHGLNLQPVWKSEDKPKENIFITQTRKINEVNTHTDEDLRKDFIALKKWSNENINPKNLK